MAEIEIVAIRVKPSKKELAAILAAVLLAGAPIELASESITLTTWYPAPYGVYSQLRSMGNSYFAYQGGNVGIGLANPASKLQVEGDIAIQEMSGHPAAIVGHADIHAVGRDVYYTDDGGYIHRITRPRVYTWLVPFQGQQWPPSLCSAPGTGGAASDTVGPPGGGYGFLIGCLGIGWWNNWQNDCHFSGYDTSVGWNYSPSQGKFPWNPSATVQWGDSIWCGAGGNDGQPAPTCKAICMNIEFDFN